MTRIFWVQRKGLPKLYREMDVFWLFDEDI